MDHAARRRMASIRSGVVAVGGTVGGTLDAPGDHDWIKVGLTFALFFVAVYLWQFIKLAIYFIF